MTSYKEIELSIIKESESYKMSEEERQKVLLRIAGEVYELVERFDGYCRIKISIKVQMFGKGNC